MNRLRVTFLDVGQGDSTVIEGPTGQIVVVDGGGSPGTDERLAGDMGGRVVVPYLRSRGLGAVDWLIPTHPDDDHVQGLISVTQSLPVRAALDWGYADDAQADLSPPYNRLRKLLNRLHVPVYPARRGQTINIGGSATLTVLHPGINPIRNGRSFTNNNCVVLRLTYGKATFLLTGDAEDAAEEAMLTARLPLKADVLKVGHHGSRWSSTERFLARVRPKVAVISCGLDNRYGHPNREVLERLQTIGASVYRTDQQGGIVVETDGETLQITPTHAPIR